MKIAIYESVRSGKVILESTRNEFFDKYGTMDLYVSENELVRKMREIKEWVTEELKEDCFFEV